jgi:hypothetical protein
MRKVVVFAIVGALLCGSALAGPLAIDPNAYFDGTTLWRGRTNITDGFILTGVVDWCVYTPTGWAAAGWVGYTPTAGEFVYAYQVENAGLAPILGFGAKMIDDNDANNIGEFDLPGVNVAANGTPPFGFSGVAPNLDMANWYWQITNLFPGQKSEGLVYSSINTPLEYDVMIHDGGVSKENIVAAGDPGVASPTPEPATLGLLAAGLIAVLRRRRR